MPNIQVQPSFSDNTVQPAEGHSGHNETSATPQLVGKNVNEKGTDKNTTENDKKVQSPEKQMLPMVSQDKEN